MIMRLVRTPLPDGILGGVSDRRSMPVPDGLAGERVDAALARLFGFSRTKAADLVAAGAVLLDGAAGRSSPIGCTPERGWTSTCRRRLAPPQVVAEPVPGMRVVYDDDDIVVVDKPVGVAAHPSPGWTGPTVVGGLAGAGFRVSTSGSAERQGIVHRLDVGTSGLMVVAKSERAYTLLKRAFKERTVEKIYHALVQGHPDPLARHRRRADRPASEHDYKWAVVANGKPSITHYETLEAHRAASLLEIRLETGRTHQIRVHMAALRHPCVGDLTYGADPTLAARLGLTRQWLHAVRARLRTPGHAGSGCSSPASIPTTSPVAGCPSPLVSRALVSMVRLATEPDEVAAAFAVRTEVFVERAGRAGRARARRAGRHRRPLRGVRRRATSRGCRAFGDRATRLRRGPGCGHSGWPPRPAGGAGRRPRHRAGVALVAAIERRAAERGLRWSLSRPRPRRSVSTSGSAMTRTGPSSTTRACRTAG